MKLFRFILLLGVFWGTTSSPVSAIDPHFHNVTFHRCYHAHSCFVSIPNVPNIFGDVLLIRIAGIDTPEILGQCDKEKQLARKARNFVNTVWTRSPIRWSWQSPGQTISVLDRKYLSHFPIREQLTTNLVWVT